MSLSGQGHTDRGPLFLVLWVIGTLPPPEYRDTRVPRPDPTTPVYDNGATTIWTTLTPVLVTQQDPDLNLPRPGVKEPRGPDDPCVGEAE